MVVEDEKRLARLLERHLVKAGYSVELAFNGEEAEEMLFSREYGLVVLDINLPKKSGFEVLRNLRHRSYETPVLIVSARGDVEDRVGGLQLGADDYIVKPFELSEMLARIESILRRSGVLRSSILQVGDLTMDVVRRVVTRNGKTIDLSEREFLLLEFFMRNKNQILTRQRIAHQVWGYAFETGTNIVDVYVSYIRKAINQGHSRKLIQTIRGEGFILTDK